MVARIIGHLFVVHTEVGLTFCHGFELAVHLTLAFVVGQEVH